MDRKRDCRGSLVIFVRSCVFILFICYVNEDSRILCVGMCWNNSASEEIQNGKVVPRIETLCKIVSATHKRLVISFESMEGDDQ